MATKLLMKRMALLLAVAALGCSGGSSTTSQPAAGGKTTKPVGSAGKSGAQPIGSAAGSGIKGTAGGAAMMMIAGSPSVDTMTADPRGACNIDSGFPDDNACILPPAPEEGMQIHIGPTDYKDSDQINKFTLKAGQETESCWTFHTPNDKKIFYQTFVLSGRSGTHHIIDTMYKVEMTDGGFTMCSDGGTGTNSNIIDNLPGASKPYMPRVPVAPENADIGRAVPPNTPSQADLHGFNFTDKDLLREFWLNIYYVPEAQVKQEATQIRGMGGLSWNSMPIAPGTDKTYSYKCAVPSDGRIMSLLGHYHAHGKQFTASIQRASGEVQKVFEMYDYLDPAMFQYDSITTNPDFSATAGGAVSGILEVHAGDTVLWDCHVVNDSMTALRYVNQVKTGEMCNLWGQSVGTKINCLVP